MKKIFAKLRELVDNRPILVSYFFILLIYAFLLATIVADHTNMTTQPESEPTEADVLEFISARFEPKNFYCVVTEEEPEPERELTLARPKPGLACPIEGSLLINDISCETEPETVSVEPIKVEVPKREVSATEAQILVYIDEVCALYPNVSPHLVRSVIYYESRFNPDAHNSKSDCCGLMQLSKKWNTDRAESLGVTDLFDPYGNILVGVDLLSELIDSKGDIQWALMCYHGGNSYGNKLWKQGKIDSYTRKIVDRAAEYETEE